MKTSIYNYPKSTLFFILFVPLPHNKNELNFSS